MMSASFPRPLHLGITLEYAASWQAGNGYAWGLDSRMSTLQSVAWLFDLAHISVCVHSFCGFCTVHTFPCINAYMCTGIAP